MKTEPLQPFFSVVRVPINRGGYDSMGHYYGTGAPVWRYQQDAHEFRGEKFPYLCGTIRAGSRDTVHAYVRATYPERGPRFYACRGNRGHRQMRKGS